MIKPGHAIGILTAALMILIGNSAGADLYKWVDPNGIIHYSDERPLQQGQDPERLPPSPSKTEAPARKVSSDGTRPPQVEVPPGGKTIQPKKVELYVTKWCKYCTMARNFLRSRNVPFVEYDIDKDSAAAKRRDALDKRPGVPLAVIHDTVILGFSAEAYEKALKLP